MNDHKEDEMPFDAPHSGTDEFQFITPSDLSSPLTATTGQFALSQALLSRDIDSSELTEAQSDILSDYADLLDTASAAELETKSDVIAQFGEQLDITFVEDFRTTDGQKLNGAATEDGQIILDADLTTAALKATLVEEIAEAAFKDAFDTTSQGDFGAEVAARLAGEADPAALAAFNSDAQNDTVETEFGTAEAAVSRPVDAGIARALTRDISRSNDLDEVNNITFTSIAPEDYGGDRFFREPLVTPTAAELDLSRIQGKYDLNGDGVLDQYALRAVEPNAFMNLQVIGQTPTKLIPTSQSNSILIGQGQASTTWVLRTEQSYETSSEFNWNSSIAVGLEASGEILGVGLSASLTATTEGGGSNRSTDKFTVANEVRETYTIPAGAYEPGTLVNYGFHMIVGDVDVAQNTFYDLEITNSRNEGVREFVGFEGFNRGIVQDHYVGLVMTDYDVNNPPLGGEILAFA
ncbi:hypothetical protein [Tateyamaria sp. ANG-S1]|uniref:hypothetical protein n=1 Tax=Tateyamaria sp. ANG-S1 TaxID=1577905 RepID=UPI00057D4247|nr:hypothetical protein [Tateyamaria sp. ANG-S1]KIC48994.1 hypothetical protein RA29_15205 [Tateyamaria sp. ANG-S1]